MTDYLQELIGEYAGINNNLCSKLVKFINTATFMMKVQLNKDKATVDNIKHITTLRNYLKLSPKMALDDKNKPYHVKEARGEKQIKQYNYDDLKYDHPKRKKVTITDENGKTKSVMEKDENGDYVYEMESKTRMRPLNAQHDFNVQMAYFIIKYLDQCYDTIIENSDDIKNIDQLQSFLDDEKNWAYTVICVANNFKEDDHFDISALEVTAEEHIPVKEKMKIIRKAFNNFRDSLEDIIKSQLEQREISKPTLASALAETFNKFVLAVVIGLMNRRLWGVPNTSVRRGDLNAAVKTVIDYQFSQQEQAEFNYTFGELVFVDGLIDCFDEFHKPKKKETE